jgi:hypothetical protein
MGHLGLNKAQLGPFGVNKAKSGTISGQLGVNKADLGLFGAEQCEIKGQF